MDDCISGAEKLEEGYDFYLYTGFIQTWKTWKTWKTQGIGNASGKTWKTQGIS